MKRFANIMVIYDLDPGCDETLQRAVDLAARNSANLTLLNVCGALIDERNVLAERKRILGRVVAGIDLPASRKSCVVRHGPAVPQILGEARSRQIDLIIAADAPVGFYAQVLGLDMVGELLRQADCPVWVVRSNTRESYGRIVAAVNAGKADALACPANRRILEMASSLARFEGSQLHVVYAWDFEGNERDMMASELPSGKYEAHLQTVRLVHLEKLVALITHVLGSTLDCLPVPVRGEPARAIIDYVGQHDADLLIADGPIDGPVMALMANGTATHLHRRSACSVLFARPGPAAALSFPVAA